jgi:hypothetical protein
MSDHDLLLTLVDVVLLVSVLEMVWLLLRRSARGLSRGALVANLLAGLGLVAALRLALAGAGLPWVAACLVGAGLAHALDLQARWRAARAQ